MKHKASVAVARFLPSWAKDLSVPVVTFRCNMHRRRLQYVNFEAGIDMSLFREH